MDFTLDDIRYLQSAAGERLLERLRMEDLSDANALALMTKLRKDYSTREAAAAVEMARLRLKAVEKFGDDAPKMFFTRAALEQASDPLIRRYRAEKSMHSSTVIDACCSIGTDALAFAVESQSVLGLDIDPVRVEIARHNAAQLGYPVHFEVSDVTTDVRLHQLDEDDLIFFDPARRTEDGKRIYDVKAYQPPLSTIDGWLNSATDRIWIETKLSPGVKIEQVDQYSGCLTFYSVDGDLKEAGLTVSNQSQGEFFRIANLFTNGHIYSWDSDAHHDSAWRTIVRAYLCEPDPALIRAGFVQDITAKFGGTMLDETIAYFACEMLPTDPDLRVWAKAWRVRAWMPFNVKRIREYMRQHNIGGVTVKKRGTAVTPEVIIPQLKLKGDNRATLILTRDRGVQIAIICDEMPVE